MNTPSNITLSKDRKLLTVTFDNIDYLMTSEYLRVYSPSAEVQGHGPGQETLQLDKQDVTIQSLVPMGNYAIAIHYSDGHTSGIYTWNHLYKLGSKKNELWLDYCNRVDDKNNSKNYHEVKI